MTDGAKRVHALISGKVQGVWFRESTLKEAERLGVHGWVRNLEDGRVEGVFEGPGDAVDALVTWCRDGPPNARVGDVQTAQEPATQEFADFRVTQ